MILELLHANVCADRYDYDHTWPHRRPYFLAEAKAVDAPLITLTECQQPAAAALAKALGYKSVSYWGSSILYDPEQLTLTRTLLKRRWLTGTQTHSLLMVEFVTAQHGRTFNLGVTHFPPFASRALLRRRALAWITKAVRGYHDLTYLAMDANWSKTLESSTRGTWYSARQHAMATAHADYRTSGGKYTVGNAIDYVLGYRRAQFAYYDVLDGRTWSDHNALNVEIIV